MIFLRINLPNFVQFKADRDHAFFCSKARFSFFNFAQLFPGSILLPPVNGVDAPGDHRCSCCQHNASIINILYGVPWYDTIRNVKQAVKVWWIASFGYLWSHPGLPRGTTNSQWRRSRNKQRLAPKIRPESCMTALTLSSYMYRVKWRHRIYGHNTLCGFNGRRFIRYSNKIESTDVRQCPSDQ